MGATNSEKIRAMTDLLREHGGVMPRSEFVGKLMAANMGKSSTLYAFIKSPKAKAFGIHTSGDGQSAIVSLTENPTGINAGSGDNVLGSAELDAYVLNRIKTLRDTYIRLGKGDAARFENVMLKSKIGAWQANLGEELAEATKEMSPDLFQLLYLKVAFTTVKE